MLKKIVSTWGFNIAGIMFLIAGIIPLMAGQKFKAAFFVIGIAFLVVGAGVSRRREQK